LCNCALQFALAVADDRHDAFLAVGDEHLLVRFNVFDLHLEFFGVVARLLDGVFLDAVVARETLVQHDGFPLVLRVHPKHVQLENDQSATHACANQTLLVQPLDFGDLV